MILRQIRSTDGTGTLTYIVGDEATRQAAVIDPNKPDTNLILDSLRDLGLQLTTIIDTHTHADHVTGAMQLKERTGAQYVMHTNAGEKWQFVHLGDAFGIGDILRENVKVSIDRFVQEGDTISVGDLVLQVRYTPGHTNDHISLQIDGHLFTGDVLLAGQAGRSDLPSGNPGEQYDTLFGTFYPLPDTTIIHPGHDYEDIEYTTLKKEKATNPFLALRSKAEYIAFVEEFFPPIADSSEHGVILQCGTRRIIEPQARFISISPDELSAMMAQQMAAIIDVREPFEVMHFGAIPGAINIPMGALLRRGIPAEMIRDKKIVVVCQTGGRSVEAAHYLASKGFDNVYELAGGTLAWLRAGKKVAKLLTKDITLS